MVSSKETTPAGYLASLEPKRREVLAAVRSLVKANLPTGYAETMNWGMLAYEIPLSRYPETYNKQPLMYVALAAQKNNYALYLTLVHDPVGTRAKLEAAYKAAGRKLDMGQSCLRFKGLDELPMSILGEIIGATSVDQLIARYEASRGAPAAKQSAAKTSGKTAKKSASKTTSTSAAKTPATSAKKPAAKTSAAAVTKTARKAASPAKTSKAAAGRKGAR